LSFAKLTFLQKDNDDAKYKNANEIRKMDHKYFERNHDEIEKWSGKMR